MRINLIKFESNISDYGHDVINLSSEFVDC